MTRAFMALCAVMALLTACGHPGTISEKPIITYVDRPVQCPSPEERERLRKLKPTPLRDQKMPTDPVARNAQSQAQLGLYEAPGGYADQVEAALNRCQK
jgi:hypothetical protein